MCITNASLTRASDQRSIHFLLAFKGEKMTYRDIQCNSDIKAHTQAGLDELFNLTNYVTMTGVTDA